MQSAAAQGSRRHSGSGLALASRRGVGVSRDWPDLDQTRVRLRGKGVGVVLLLA